MDKERIPVEEKLVGCGGDPFLANAIADLTPSEREAWLRMYHAPAYKAELRRLRDWGVPGPEDDDE